MQRQSSQQIIKQLADSLGLSTSEVEDVIKSQYEVVCNMINDSDPRNGVCHNLLLHHLGRFAVTRKTKIKIERFKKGTDYKALNKDKTFGVNGYEKVVLVDDDDNIMENEEEHGVNNFSQQAVASVSLCSDD